MNYTPYNQHMTMEHVDAATTDMNQTGWKQFEADILQQVQNAVQEALLVNAPEHWQDELLEEIEAQVISDLKKRLATLSIDALSSPQILSWEKCLTVAETKTLIRRSSCNEK